MGCHRALWQRRDVTFATCRERVPLCRSDLAQLKDADTVAISMKFRSGAIVTLDVSQHCTKTCDHRLEVRSRCSVESVATPRASTKPLKTRVLLPVCCLPAGSRLSRNITGR